MEMNYSVRKRLSERRVVTLPLRIIFIAQHERTDASHAVWLLRPCPQRPSSRANPRNELPSSHSITSLLHRIRWLMLSSCAAASGTSWRSAAAIIPGNSNLGRFSGNPTFCDAAIGDSRSKLREQVSHCRRLCLIKSPGCLPVAPKASDKTPPGRGACQAARWRKSLPRAPNLSDFPSSVWAVARSLAFGWRGLRCEFNHRPRYKGNGPDRYTVTTIRLNSASFSSAVRKCSGSMSA